MSCVVSPASPGNTRSPRVPCQAAHSSSRPSTWELVGALAEGYRICFWSCKGSGCQSVPKAQARPSAQTPCPLLSAPTLPQSLLCWSHKGGEGAPSALVMDFIYYAPIKGQTWADAKVTQSFEAGIHTSLTRAGGSKRLRD